MTDGGGEPSHVYSAAAGNSAKDEPLPGGIDTGQVRGLALYDQKIVNQEEFNRGWQAGLESVEGSVGDIKFGSSYS